MGADCADGSMKDCEPSNREDAACRAHSADSASTSKSAHGSEASGGAASSRATLANRFSRAFRLAAKASGIAALCTANILAMQYMIHEEIEANQIEVVHGSVRTPVEVDGETFARLTHVKIGDDEFDLPCKGADFVSRTGRWHVRSFDVDRFIQQKTSMCFESYLINDDDPSVRLTATLFNPTDDLLGWTACDVTSVRLGLERGAGYPMEVAGMRVGDEGGMAGGLAWGYEGFTRHGRDPYDVTWSYFNAEDGRIVEITATFDAEHIIQNLSIELLTDAGRYVTSGYWDGEASS